MNNKLFQNDSETAVLSILIRNPDMIFDIVDLKYFMFSSDADQKLFNIMRSISEDGSLCSISLLEQELKSSGELENVGGLEYLEHLYRLDYDTVNLKRFVKFVVDSYKARELFGIVTKVSSRIQNSSNIDSLIEQARSALDSLSANSHSSLAYELSDALPSVWDQITTRVTNPGVQGWSVGIENIDLMTNGISPGEVWFVGGRPSQGKTASMVNFALHQVKNNIGVLLFQYEMNKQQLTERFISVESGVPIIDIRLGKLNQEDIDKIKESMKTLKGLPLIIDTSFNPDLEYIISTIRRYKKLTDIKVVYLDYIQLIAQRSGEAVHELGRISRSLKLLAGELNIGVVIISQIHRGVESRDDKRPILSDLRQSGNMEEDGDLVMFVYRDSYYKPNTNRKGEIEFIIRKQRNGPVGTVIGNFEADTNLIK